MNIDLLFESTLFLAAICFSLSVYVLARGMNNRLNLSYAILSAIVSIWSFSFFLARVLEWRFFESVHLIATLLIPMLGLYFIDVLLRPTGLFFKLLKRLAILFPIIFIPLVTLGLDRYPLIRDASYFSPSFISWACLYLFFSDFPITPGTDVLWALRRHNRWIFLGGLFVTMVSVMDHVPWMGRTIPAIGNLILAIYFYILKDVVLFRHFLNFRGLVGRILANVVSGFVVALVVIFMTQWVRTNHILFMLNAFLAAYVAVVSVDPVRRLVNLLFQKVFFKEAARVEAIIEDANKEIAGAFQALAIAQATNRFLQKVLGENILSFYSVDEDGKNFHKILDLSSAKDLPTVITAHFPLVQHWAKVKQWQPVLEPDLEKAPAQLTTESLRVLRSTLALPLVYRGAVLGFVTLHVSDPPDPWENWGILALLAPYFLRAGEALHELDVYARLRERDRLAILGEMAAGLAHEIRNPLGAIKGAAQLLDPKPGDEQEGFIRIIVEEVNRLNRVVSQFLDYAKPFRGKFTNADITSVMQKTVQGFTEQKQALFKDSLIEIKFYAQSNLGSIECQPELLGQVLVNLLENAWHALSETTNKQKKISVHLEQVERNGIVMIRIVVEDNGPGIAAENLEKLFIPFYTTRYGGTGLGLPICQRIVEAHGGVIEVASEVGQGTKIQVFLPMKPQRNES